MRLDVSFTCLDADALLALVAAHSPFLSALRANCLDGGTDEGVARLARSPCAKALEVLHIEGYSELTFRAAGDIRKNCAALVSLNISGCSGLSEESVFELALDLKRLNSFATSRIGLSTRCQFALVNMMHTRPSRNPGALSRVELAG